MMSSVPANGGVPTWRIEPVGPLRGDVVISGSKNVVTKLMVASLLSSEPGVVLNAPRIGDVELTAGMLRSLGAEVDIDQPARSVSVDPANVLDSRIPVSYSGLNRVPILLVGPMLHRIGEVFVPLVGGDRIGARPIDFHVTALRQLGAEVELSPEGLEAKALRLHGAHIRLPFPSVGATETVLLTAVAAEGRTTVENAAIEPEVVELALFLQRMGARIELQPDRTFVIEGVEHLTGARQRLGGDRIEAFSYLIAGLATGGRVRIVGCAQDRLVTAISILQRIGADFQFDDEGIAAEVGPRGLRHAAVQTDTHPGFMTDWQPGLVVLFTQALGMSVLHETVFEDRLGYVDALRAMNAEVELFDQCLVGQSCRFAEAGFLHSALVRGVSELGGAEIEMPDIRAAFSYVIAAAAAHSPSTLHGVHHLERGYDDALEKFSSLGLRITPVGGEAGAPATP
ncbi:MAG: UDP-N-acetylglucosamine 1-carboxyvinyltransferase [Acidimicrobiales bacterium]